MSKFFTVSVCLIASLAANAKIHVTKCADGATDSITINGSFTDEELRNTKVVSSVKIATGNYELSESEWEKICNNLVANKVYTIDLSETRFGYTLTKDNFGGKLTNWGNNNITNVTFSRYADIPDDCLGGNAKIVSITVPDKKSKDSGESLTIGEKAFQQMKKLKTLYIGSCVTSIGDRMCECTGPNESSLASVKFNTPQIQELPTGCFQWCSKLTKIDLPTNLKVVGENAFAHCNLATVTFPLTLTTIKVNAFMDCNLEYIVIPENVTSIESFAFQGNKNLSDVYVMGSKVKCAANGFTNQKVSNGFVNKTTGYDEQHPSISNADWAKNGEQPAVLHFVSTDAESRNNYYNPYWVMLNTPGILEELKNLKKDEPGVQDAFLAKYNLHKGFPWSLWRYAVGDSQDCPFAYYRYKDNEGKEKTCKIWREEEGYYSDADKMNPDYAGWQMFLLVQDDAKQNTFEDEHRVDDRWYSMCFPFDLNANQIRTAYGAGTEVCEFVGAWESEEKDEQGRTIIDFRYKPLLDEDEVEAISEGFDEDNARATSPIITKANRSYMIHPASKKEGDNTNVWYRIIPGIPMDIQHGEQANLIPTIPEKDFDQEMMSQFEDGESHLLKGYRFIGNYEDNIKLPAFTYYFAYRDNADGSRLLVLNHLTRESKYNWTPMTALVYEPKEASTANYAKKLTYCFKPIKDNETTGTKDFQAPAFCSKDMNDAKVYNLNGQVVKDGTSLHGLGKGVYIFHGKKYMVK